MLKFLVDVNLPKHFHYFNEPHFVHIIDINPKMSDEEIWNYALENDFVIITKNTDFYTRFITSSKTPKLVYLKLGNQTLKEMHDFFKANWPNILSLLESSRFIIVTKSAIEYIN